MNQVTQPAGEEVVVINDALWEKLVELTHGDVALCYQCGVCTATCPWGLVRDQIVSVRTFMRKAQLGLRDGNEGLWLCTTCAQCEAYCPRGVSITDVFRGLRYLAWEQREAPEGLPSLLWSVYWNNNPWAQPPSQRSRWAANLGIPPYDPDQHEILFYVGCTSSYDRRAQAVARSLVLLLNAAGVQYGFLGDDEPCCGEAVLNVGHKLYFQEVVQQAIGVFRNRGVARIVTISPHCYDVFRNHYPQFCEGFYPLHYTQYLAQLVEEGRIRFERPLECKVTFHDPCYLARHNSEVEAPRRILEAIPGLELAEMENVGLDTLCCGGGGGRMWMETAAGERFSDLRVQEVLATGADILATACPFCIVCLEDSLKAKKIEGVAVMDIAEIAALALAGQPSSD